MIPQELQLQHKSLCFVMVVDVCNLVVSKGGILVNAVKDMN
jgi:hypothetical protein